VPRVVVELDPVVLHVVAAVADLRQQRIAESSRSGDGLAATLATRVSVTRGRQGDDQKRGRGEDETRSQNHEWHFPQAATLCPAGMALSGDGHLATQGHVAYPNSNVITIGAYDACVFPMTMRISRKHANAEAEPSSTRPV